VLNPSTFCHRAPMMAGSVYISQWRNLRVSL